MRTKRRLSRRLDCKQSCIDSENVLDVFFMPHHFTAILLIRTVEICSCKCRFCWFSHVFICRPCSRAMPDNTRAVGDFFGIHCFFSHDIPHNSYPFSRHFRECRAPYLDYIISRFKKNVKGFIKSFLFNYIRLLW